MSSSVGIGAKSLWNPQNSLLYPNGSAIGSATFSPSFPVTTFHVCKTAISKTNRGEVALQGLSNLTLWRLIVTAVMPRKEESKNNSAVQYSLELELILE